MYQTQNIRVNPIAYAGSGSNKSITGYELALFKPNSLYFANSKLYFTNALNHQIGMINETGHVSVLAGNGTAGFKDGNADAQFNNPLGITMDPVGNLYGADTNNNWIRKIQNGAV